MTTKSSDEVGVAAKFELFSVLVVAIEVPIETVCLIGSGGKDLGGVIFVNDDEAGDGRIGGFPRGAGFGATAVLGMTNGGFWPFIAIILLLLLVL